MIVSPLRMQPRDERRLLAVSSSSLSPAAPRDASTTGGRKPIAHCTKPARSTLARNPSVWNPKASEGNEPTTYALPAGSRATPFSTSIPGQFTSVDDTRFPEASYRATYPVPFPPDPSPYEPTTTASPAGSTAMPLAVSTPSVAMVRTQRVPPAGSSFETNASSPLLPARNTAPAASVAIAPRPLCGDPRASVRVQRVVPSGAVRMAITGSRPPAAAMSPEGVMTIPKVNPSASTGYVWRQSSVPSGAQRPMNEFGSEPQATTSPFGANVTP